MISKNNFGSHGYKTALLITGMFLSWSNEVSTAPYDASSLSKYENMQFKSCFVEPSLTTETHSKDWMGIAGDTSSKKENSDLRKINTIINKNHKKIISLLSKGRHEKSLGLAKESIDLINSSNIFNLNFLKRFKDTKPGERRINGVSVDDVSAGQYASVLIASLGYESSVKLGLSKLQQRYWLELSLKYSRWIHKNRGCFSNSDFNLKGAPRVCSLVNPVEAVVSKNLFLLDYEKGDFKSAISSGSLALTAFTLWGRKWDDFGANVLPRLNILIRLADISERNKKFCISSRSYERSVKLGKKIQIKQEIIDSWQASFVRVSKFVNIKEDSWNAQYGNLKIMKDSDKYIPIYQVPPVYPRRALEREIEGCVMIQVTVKEDGTTKDPEVLWSVPSKIFDRSAMNSALKYRYVPQMVEGRPIEVSNVKTIVVFKIESPGKDMYYNPPGCE
jgi:TonB family protein